MYDTMVSEPFCTSDYDQVRPAYGDSYAVDDCGKPAVSVLYHCIFQVFSTFAVLNVVIAIILGAFTWCYSLEESELTSNLVVTADNLRHFRAIWDRFDLYSTGQIDVRHLQLFLATVRWNIPQMFCTGVRTQQDELLYLDYSSFGSLGTDLETGERIDSKEPEKGKKEKVCRKHYNELLVQLGDFERSAELWRQLEMAGCDVWMGGNDNVAGFDIKQHPLGSTDANLHIFTKEVTNGFINVPQWEEHQGTTTTVENVSFMSLINVLVMKPLGLCDHDVYVCFEFKDPFSYFQPGYFGDKVPGNGKLELNTDPNSIRLPMEIPATFQRERVSISQEDLIGTYKLKSQEQRRRELDYITDGITSEDMSLSKGKNATRPVTQARGIA